MIKGKYKNKISTRFKQEEVELPGVFGKQFAEYRTRVGCIIWVTGKTTHEA